MKTQIVVSNNLVKEYSVLIFMDDGFLTYETLIEKRQKLLEIICKYKIEDDDIKNLPFINRIEIFNKINNDIDYSFVILPYCSNIHDEKIIIKSWNEVISNFIENNRNLIITNSNCSVKRIKTSLLTLY